MIKEIEQLKELVRSARAAGKTIGLVPTMGYLHEGHLTLMREARKKCNQVVVSIFVNPLQFGIGEDFEEYPRDLTRDAEMAATVPVDVIFAPSVASMYPRGYNTSVDVESITDTLCGCSRPDHFRGVTTVVNKLFNLVEPHVAFFGQKDAQQGIVIKRMVEDLNMNLEIVTVPIVREADGLALSSRNVYLSPEERGAALVLHRSLSTAREMIDLGEKDAGKVKEVMVAMIEREPLAKIDYVELADLHNLKPVTTLEGPVLIALAVRFGKTRLIDNIMVEDKNV
ncbi:MAG: pantoate--beta-alanine ligase [Thermincolia bacterium]